jgi:hypothetical protein
VSSVEAADAEMPRSSPLAAGEAGRRLDAPGDGFPGRTAIALVPGDKSVELRRIQTLLREAGMSPSFVGSLTKEVDVASESADKARSILMAAPDLRQFVFDPYRNG